MTNLSKSTVRTLDGVNVGLVLCALGCICMLAIVVAATGGASRDGVPAIGWGLVGTVLLISGIVKLLHATKAGAPATVLVLLCLSAAYGGLVRWFIVGVLQQERAAAAAGDGLASLGATFSLGVFVTFVFLPLGVFLLVVVAMELARISGEARRRRVHT